MRVALVGVGLIGGSVGMAARRRLGARRHRLGPRPGRARAALERGAIDAAAPRVAALGETGADVAVAAVPVDALGAPSSELCAALPGAVITDVGSTKRALVEAIDVERFIGGHPLAGAEAAGVAHAREDLFEGATWYLTPRARAPGRALRAPARASSPGSAPRPPRSPPPTTTA